MRARARVLAALAALAAALPAAADDPAARGFDPDPHRFALGLDGDFMVETAAVQPRGSWRAELALQWVHGLLAWKDGAQTVGYVVPDRIGAELLGTYSLGWIELGVGLPAALHQSSDLSPLTSLGVTGPLVAPVASTAVGDLSLFGKVALLSEESAPLGLAALLEVRAPTGSRQAFTGDGPMAIPGLVATRHLGALRLDGQLGYVFRGQGQYLQLVVHDGVTYGLGASYDLPRAPLFPSWRAIADLTGQVPRGDSAGTDRYRAPLAARAGVRAVVWRDLALELGAGTGLGEGGYGRESWRVFAGLRWERILPPPAAAPVAGPVAAPADRDGDGVPDAEDRCPDQPGPKELEGCPDSDGDGIPDIDDKCPDEPGPAQNDGCPGEPVVEVETGRLSLKDAINFDTGKDTIRPESDRILGEIASVLKSHPEVKRVRVEGHTDNVGGSRYNLELSQRRAQAVVNALAARGVPRDRMVPVGYGFTRPVASNATALGRAKNRRVEFTIVQEGGSGAEGGP